MVVLRRASAMEAMESTAAMVTVGVVKIIGEPDKLRTRMRHLSILCW
jgi:hypothetical protein